VLDVSWLARWRASSRWRRWRGYFPLTNLGILVLALGGGTFVLFAEPRVDYVLQLASALAVVLVALAVVVVVPGAWLVARAYRRATGDAGRAAGDGARGAAVVDDPAPGERVDLEATRGFATLLELPRFRAFPVLDVDWTWVSPTGFAVRLVPAGPVLREEVSALERAEVDHIERRFTIEDAFGLARVTLHRTERRPVRVTPYVGRLTPAPMLRSQAGGEDLSHPLGSPDGDRVEMRHYVPGDPLRLALWKIYARTGELLVRMPERAVSPSWRIIAYLVAAENDEPAAAAARVAISSGMMGDGWRFSADGAAGGGLPAVAEDRETALRMIVRSRGARGAQVGDGAGLSAFLDATAGLSRRRLVVFTPATPGPWLDRVASAVRSFDGRATVVVATDRVVDTLPTPSRLDRVLRRAADAPLGLADTTLEHLESVLGALGAAGAEVVAVERPTGRVLSTGRGLRPDGRAEASPLGGAPADVARAAAPAAEVSP
jgi:hypothetical protein